MYRIAFLFLTCLFIACSNETSSSTEVAPDNFDQLGELHESFSVSKEAKEAFETGLLLLHNFEYEDARSAFLEAQDLDPEAVINYWGEAMTHNHPLWRRQDFEGGLNALNKFGETAEIRSTKVANDLEKGLLQSVEILFGEGEKDERDQAYNAHMKSLHEQYPAHEEIATFYALSILGAVPVGRDVEAYEAGASVAKSVLTKNPNHPGALHYLIHSYDDPAHAHLALDAAASYSKVAADAVHALHMPSHIFLAVGMWDNVVSSNIASFNASVKRKEEKGLDNSALSYHALNWLQYGHLQLGNTEEAKKIMEDMINYIDELPNESGRGYGIAMRGAYLLETNDWDHPISNYEINLDELGLTAKAKKYFTDGKKAAINADHQSLKEIILTLEDEIKKSSLLVDESGLPMCSSGSGSSYKINRLDLDQAQVMLYLLKSIKSNLEEDPDQEEAYLIQATELEGQLGYGYGPPVILIPSFEMYGDFLISLGRMSDAKTQFEKSLERSPKRRLSELGLEKTTEENI